MTAEQLIASLQKEIEKLKEDLAISEANVKDFELAGHEWKKGYAALEQRHRVKVGNLEQTIKELEEELRNKDES